MKRDSEHWVERSLSAGDGRYRACPHANGFCDGRARIVLGQIEDDGVSVWQVGLNRPKADGRRVARFVSDPDAGGGAAVIWFDVTEATDTLVTVAGGIAWLADLRTDRPMRALDRATPGPTLGTLPSITAATSTGPGAPGGRVRLLERQD